MSIDKVLAVLDAGLQSSEERGYPERIDDVSLCARCIIHEPAPTADICRECRAFLLGDSDVDPIRAGLHVGHDSMIRGYIATNTLVTEADVERLRAEWSGPDLSQLEPDPAWVAHQDPEGRHVHSFDYIGQCECGVCDIGVRPSLRVRFQRLDRDGVPTGEPESLEGYVVHHVDGDPRNNSIDNLRIMPAQENATQNPTPWARQQYVGDGRSVWSYAGWGASGSYATDDPRPFTVAEYAQGPWRGAQLLNADDVMVHFMANARPDYDYSLPAAYRVAEDTVAPTGRWLVVCHRCGAHYSADRERFDEANAIMVAEGHGTGGSCDPLTRTLRRDYYVDGHGDVHTSVRSGRDWQAEMFAWLRQIVSDARGRLGL